MATIPTAFDEADKKVAEDELGKYLEHLDTLRASADKRAASQYSPAVEEPEEAVTAADGDEVERTTRLPKWAETGAGTLFAPRVFGLPDDGYDSLRAIYAMALEQAQGGKGRERHANGLPFDRQPICQGGRRFGVGCLIYQAWKKAHETPVLMTMDNGTERAIRELLGVINYAAAAILVIKEGK